MAVEIILVAEISYTQHTMGGYIRSNLLVYAEVTAANMRQETKNEG